MIHAMEVPRPKHPAKFSDPILHEIGHGLFKYLPDPHEVALDILDPFAGVGRIHKLGKLGYATWGIEIEPEWARQGNWTKVGDCREVMRKDLAMGRTYNAIVTSPCYGNRMADHHEAKDSSERNTYRHKLGRPLSEGSSAGMQWGAKYRDFHVEAWCEAWNVLEPGGVFVLNIKNHIRQGKVQKVAEWHVTTLLSFGLELLEVQPVATPGNRRGQNHELRLDHELVCYFRKDAA